MTACFYPIRIENITPKKNDKYRFIDYINLIYYINKTKLDDIIRYILYDYCGVSVLGYYKSRHVYWCKKNSKYSCDLHLEISIIKKDDNYSQIKISALVGNDLEIVSFIKKLHESLQLYETTNFIKTCLDKQLL
jgi:hypothetical protein